MKASYRQLLGEHEMIERAARDLLSDLGNDRADAASLSKQLDELARVVEGHIKLEDAVISDFDADRLTGPWTAAWVDGICASGIVRLLSVTVRGFDLLPRRSCLAFASVSRWKRPPFTLLRYKPARSNFASFDLPRPRPSPSNQNIAINSPDYWQGRA